MKNELIKSENKILVGTSFEGLRLREENTDTLKSTLYDCLLRGHKVSKTQTTINLQEEIQSSVELLSKSVTELHGGITLTELSKALTNGFMGVYGDYYGVTPLTVMNFLKKYSESDERKRAVQESKRLKEKQQSEPKEMTIEEKREFWNEAKEEYKKDSILFGELFLYKLGRNLELIDLTDEIFVEEIKFKALKWFQNEYERIKVDQGLSGKMALSKIREVIDASEDERTKLHLWQNRCKRLAVQLTFDQNK